MKLVKLTLHGERSLSVYVNRNNVWYVMPLPSGSGLVFGECDDGRAKYLGVVEEPKTVSSLIGRGAD